MLVRCINSKTISQNKKVHIKLHVAGNNLQISLLNARHDFCEKANLEPSSELVRNKMACLAMKENMQKY